MAKDVLKPNLGLLNYLSVQAVPIGGWTAPAHKAADSWYASASPPDAQSAERAGRPAPDRAPVSFEGLFSTDIDVGNLRSPWP